MKTTNNIQIDSKVGISNSLALQLLKNVFSLYLVFTFSLTFFQMYISWSTTKKSILTDMLILENTFKDSLVRATWNGDKGQLLSIMNGMNQNPKIVAAKFTSDIFGEVDSREINLEKQRNEINQKDEMQNNFFYYLVSNIFKNKNQHFSYSFDLNYFDNEKTIKLGTMELISHVGVVYNEVKWGFVFIILSAILKTVVLWFIVYYVSIPLLRNPLKNMASVAKKINFDKINELRMDVDVDKKNELTLLQVSFNQMLDNLANAKQELDHTNQNLEKLVIERLSQLNEVQRVAKLGSWHFDIQNKKMTWTKELFALFELDSTDKELTIEEIGQLMQKEDARNWNRHMLEAQKSGKYFNMQFSFFNKDKKVVFIEVQATGVFDNNKNLIAISGTFQDISEKVDKERELTIEKNKSIQASKMATLGEMASGIAHEINNPLTILSGFNYKLSKLSTSEEIVKKEEILKCTEYIDEAVKRMAKIINGLRAFARDGSNQPKTRVQLTKLISDSLILCRTQFDDHKIRFDVETDDTIFLDCREILISQVIVNLVNNAYQAIKSEPNLKDKMAKLITFKKDNYAFIVVEDNGPLVPDEIREKIFEPFFTTKKIGEGTGLGLSISKGIIESHQGELLLEQSNFIKKFIIKLPIV